MHALFLALLLAGPADPAVKWPAFLGQGATALPAEGVPLTWSPDANLAWKVDLPGHGQSSPVVWGAHVFLTAVAGPNKETNIVLCLNLADGSEVWRSESATAFEAKNDLYHSRAAPTPVVDQQHVYCYFESGDVLALTHAGKQVWTRNLTADYGAPQNQFGLAASPVQTADAVVILVDDQGPSYLIAVSKRDGSTLWKTDRTGRVSWSSPALVPVEGALQVVVSSAGSVDGYDPATGTLLWSLTEGIGGNTVATPVPFGDGIFLVAASPGQRGETAEAAKTSNFAVKIERVATGYQPKVLWRTDRAFPSFGSPIVHAGYAYWVNRQGVVYCFDAATGEEAYTQRTPQSIWATPFGIGDRVYLFGKEGTTTVLAAGPEFKILAENQLWNPDAPAADPATDETDPRRRAAAAMFGGPTQYGVAAVPGHLLIRTGEVLYCVGRK